MNTLMLAALLAIIPAVKEADPVISVQVIGGVERSSPAFARARALASQMFFSAGVDLEWCDRAATCRHWNDRIVVTLERSAPSRLPNSARAEAQVFQGRDIWIYLDRMPPTSHPAAHAYWAHVLVHEITHLLQAVDHHADHGVMKSHWSKADVARMQAEPLPFTELDIQMIHAGIAHRRRAPLTAETASR